MNEELQKALAQMITSLSETASQVKDFSSEQAPLVIKEFLTWRLLSAEIWTGIGGVLVIGYLLWIWKIASLKPEPHTNYKGWAWRSFGPSDADVDMRETALTSLIIGGFLALVGLVFFVVGGLEVLHILIAPKVYLLEYIKDLAN